MIWINMFWLVNHSWESFKKTKEYCGFVSEAERNKIKIGDKIVYFGQGIVFGLFQAITLPDEEFKGWKKAYPFQVKLKAIVISSNGLVAKVLQDKILFQKSQSGSSNLVELSESEFNQIKKAIENEEKELKFD